VSVLDPTTIDVVGEDRTTGVIVLSIADHLSWDDINGHFALLEAKVRAYVGFVEGGESLEQYARAANQPVEVRVVAKHSLPAAVVPLVTALQQATERRGIRFTHVVLHGDPHHDASN